MKKQHKALLASGVKSQVVLLAGGGRWIVKRRIKNRPYLCQGYVIVGETYLC